MKINPALPIAALAVFFLMAHGGTAEAPAQAVAVAQGEPARPAAAHWLRSELYFAVGPVGLPDGGIAEMRWRAFLDREVTPRFPDGLTVFDAFGQWRSSGQAAPSRLRSKVLVILHEDTPANRAAIEDIRLAWKAATRDQSVLVATERADVSF